MGVLKELYQRFLFARHLPRHWRLRPRTLDGRIVRHVVIDNEYRLPIRYAAYLWPTTPGGEPPLEEAYTYVNLKINNGFTDFDFSRENPELFKSE